MKGLITVIAAALLIATFCNIGQCDEEAAGKLLKQGLLGAATGAVASGASGGKAGKGALYGAGVNIVGGMLFDAMSGEKVEKVETVEGMGSTEAYQQGYGAGFKKGYDMGFEKGLVEGYKTSKE